MATPTGSATDQVIEGTDGESESFARPAEVAPISTGDAVIVTSPIVALQSWPNPGASMTLAKNAVLQTIAARPGSDTYGFGLFDVFHGVRSNGQYLYCGEQNSSSLQVIRSPLVSHGLGTLGSHSAESSCAHQEEQDGVDSSPLTLLGTVPYADIVSNMCQKDVPEDVARQIASFLEVKHLKMTDVSVSRASSTRGDFPLSSVLGNVDGTWWISAEGSMPDGRGEQYLEFRLAPDGGLRRLSFVGLSIPPLPQGPLSVRHFRIDWSLDGKTWVEGNEPHTMETMDLDGMQTFCLPEPIDVAHVRLVCLQNADSAQREGRGDRRRSRSAPSPFDCVGLFHVRWK